MKCPNCGVKLMLTEEAPASHFIPKSKIEAAIALYESLGYHEVYTSDNVAEILRELLE